MGFKVTDTKEISRMSPAGTMLKLYRVWLVTDRGATGTVDVEEPKWNKDNLPSILADKAAELDLAFELTQ